jgi:2',3'-cyclic-nucleotide 2'-phosphodiesterase (5'-nucleotidase family)
MNRTARAAALLLLLGLLGCGTPDGSGIPPQSPASLSGPAFDTSPLYPVDTPDLVEIHVLHTNDLHGQVYPRKGKGGFDALFAYVGDIRAEHPHVLLLDSGDIWAGTPEGNLTRGKLPADLMNALKYDAAALGNHEFDNGIDELVDFAKALQFPLLAANVLPRTGELGNKGSAAITPLAIIEKGGVKIGLVGLITPSTPEITHKEAGAAFEFGDPLVGLNDAIGSLKAEGADFVIVLSHLGVEDEKKLAAMAPPEVVAILGGHSHTPLDPPYRDDETGIIVMQSGSKTAGIDHLVIQVTKDGVKVTDGQLVALGTSEWPKHPEVAEIVGRYAPTIEELMGRKVGTCPDALRRIRGKVRSSTLGNWITDVMRASTGADAALHNKTGIRSDLEKGDVAVRGLYEVAPFDNTIVVVELTGEQLTALIDHAAGDGRTYLEASNIKVRYDLKAEAGKRITELVIGGRQVDPTKTYRIATNSFLATGGDGHVIFTRGKHSTDGKLLRDALIDHLSGGKGCTTDKSARIAD